MIQATVSRPLLHGPLKSSVLGNAFLVDLTAPQSNLVVERGSQLPRASLVVTSAARKLIELSKAGEKLESIALVGSDQDPTVHPNLREVTENLRALRDKWFPRAKLCLFTGSFDLAAYDLRQNLSMFDKLFQTFEWGTAKTFSALTGEKGPALATLVKHLRGFDHLAIQARFCQGSVDNSTASEIKSWIKKLAEVRPQEVHILPGVPPRSRKKVKPVTKARQKQIADELAEATGLPVTVHDEAGVELAPVD